MSLFWCKKILKYIMFVHNIHFQEPIDAPACVRAVGTHPTWDMVRGNGVCQGVRFGWSWWNSWVETNVKRSRG